MIEVIAEIGINHNGDLGIAKQLIDVAKAAGCDYVKFQKRTIDLCYSKEELEKPRESQWGTTTRQQKEGLEFGELAYHEIDSYCKQRGIKWFASPWDIISMAFLAGFENVPYIKIASAVLTNKALLSIQSVKQPFILSTGGSTFEQISEAIDIIGKDRIHCIMHCTSTYPTKPDEINASFIPKMKDIFPWTKIGFSNHYPGLMAMRLAAAYGAEMIEFHLTLDRAMVGSDHAASIEPKGAFELVRDLRLIERMRGDGVKRVYDSELPIMAKLRRK